MTLKQTLDKLKALGNEKMFAQNKKRGASDNQFGVRMGDIRKVAKEIKFNRPLAIELWNTEIIEARLLAILLLKPKDLSPDKVDEMVRSINFFWVADWFNSYIASKHPDNEILRQKWMTDSNPQAARAGWNLTSIRARKNAEGLDLKHLLDRIEKDMADAAPEAQWTMNFALVEIGINHPDLRKRAINIGEKLGVYRDYVAPKGCTSPFAPIWINEMVRRQK